MNTTLLQSLRSRKVHIFTPLLIVLGIIFFIYYTFFFFHITRTSPADKIMPTSYSSVVIEFNKTLKKRGDQNNLKVSIKSESNKSSYLIDGSTLTINFQSTFEKGDTFSVDIKDITAKDGGVVDFKRDYIVEYVPLDKLPKEDIKKLTQKSDSFETQYPLIKNLPIESEEYSVNYRYPDNGSNQKMPIIISSSFNLTTNSPNGIPTQADTNEYLQALRDSRNSAIKRLKMLGYNKNKYTLYFNEPYLTEEFNGYYINSLDN